MVKKNRSWFTLITFCTGTALVAALGLAALFTATTVTFAVAGNPEPSSGNPVNPETQEAGNTAGGRTYVGLITDNHCGARHDMESGLNPSECARMCVRNGAKYVLVDGQRKYTLDGKPDELEKLLGQRAKVVGTLAGTTINVSSTSSGQ